MDWILFGKLIVWALVGAFAGSLAARVVTRSREGYGPWVHLLIGMAGAVVGGLLFGLMGIDFGLGQITVSVADLLAAFIGSLLCIGAWALWKRRGASAGDS
jgi:uncharacterized membrane protein YeaQ/YmgE (transglycosylase-associated protein family)